VAVVELITTTFGVVGRDEEREEGRRIGTLTRLVENRSILHERGNEIWVYA
jgi:hypothetical protein